MGLSIASFVCSPSKPEPAHIPDVHGDGWSRIPNYRYIHRDRYGGSSASSIQSLIIFLGVLDL